MSMLFLIGGQKVKSQVLEINDKFIKCYYEDTNNLKLEWQTKLPGISLKSLNDMYIFTIYRGVKL